MAMGRDQVLPFLGASGRRFAAGLAAWAALFAIIVQVLTPLAPARADMTGDGRYLPVCGLHDFDAAGPSPGDRADCRHCPLCQVQAFDRLVVPVRPAVPAFAAAILQSAKPAVFRGTMPGRAAVLPPLPSRGPPFVA